MNKLIMILRESRAARFLIPVGIMLIVFGCIFFAVSKKNQDYIQTEATVLRSELEQEAQTDASGNRTEAVYTLFVKYTVNGKDYEGELNGMGDMKAGKKMTIYYNPSDPAQITQSKSLIVPLIMAAVGVAALAGGIVSAVNAVKKVKRLAEQEKEWANGN